MTAVLTLEAFDRERAKSLIVDVLPRRNYRLGHIPGALNWPVDEISELAPKNISDRGARIVVYCASPSCPHGARAVAILTEMGYRDVLLFPGGIEEWKSSGRALERQQDMLSRNDRSDRVVRVVNSLTVRQWVGLWFAMILLCASTYWLGGLTPWPGLAQNGKAVRTDWYGFADCLYFSFVTATTVGYGDIVPQAIWARALAATEAMGGMVLVGAVISRLLSSQQEKLLQDTHDLAFNERLGRMQTSLHLLISEFQDLEALHIGGNVDRAKIEMRLSSGGTILLRDLRIVQELLHERSNHVGDASLEFLFVTLSGTLQAYLDALQVLKVDQTRNIKQLAQVISGICSECMPSEISPELRTLIRQTESFAIQMLTRCD